MEPFPLRIQSIARKNHLTISEEQLSQLSKYVSLLVDWNSKINLIARSDVQNVWSNHILHSLSILFFVSFPTGARVLDLGTGGGLPGIPLAILRSDLHLTLLDSIAKKTKAVQDMVGNLGLRNAAVETGRAESFEVQSRLKLSFDVVIARAVAPLVDLIKWSKPLLRQMGHLSSAPESGFGGRHFPTPYVLTLKGGDLSQEIDSAKLKTKPKKVEKLELVFEGSEEIGLQDKKIIIVQF
ncbi:MAG: 16S rRNA (guanine(527)-N(7))-methyltransferase RsmG [Ignavibacteriae bacterium]|nr:16S rRNA (guanine(527)-N(7))-methyltransferase RsmG [Ignavibacteriota bacterium]